MDVPLFLIENPPPGQTLQINNVSASIVDCSVERVNISRAAAVYARRKILLRNARVASYASVT